MIGKIIDLFSGQPVDLPVTAATAAVLLALVFAIGAAANMGRTIMMRIAGQRIVSRLREAAYSQLAHRPLWHALC